MVPMDYKISVIIPAYNIRDYIENCLESVFHQTYENLEIIVVDDGSTDGTGSLLDEISKKETRLRVFHQKNAGVTNARLYGVRKAAGEYIGFVDGDDEIEPDMYRHLLENAFEYHADISHCGYQMIFPSRIDYYYNTGRLVEQDHAEGLKDLLEGSFVEPALWNKLFRRELFGELLQNNRMNTEVKNMEDLLLNYYLFDKANLSIYEDICPYHYLLRKNSAATSKNTEHKLKDPVTVLRILLKETNDEPELKEIVDRRLIQAMVRAAAVSQKDQPESVQNYCTGIQAELKKMLPGILKSRSFKKNDKIKALWAGISPRTYRLVHSFYARISGIDRMYEVE